MSGYVRVRGRRMDGTNKWQARWRKPDDPSVRIEQMFRSKREGDRWLTRMDNDAWDGSYVDPRKSDRPFEEVANAWRETWADLEPKTRAGYEAILQRHVIPRFGAAKVGGISTEAVQRYVNGLVADRAPNTVRRIFGVVRSVFRVALERRYIAIDPCGAVKLPKKGTGRRISITPLRHDQVRALADGIKPSYRALVLTAAYTGLRAGELGALRREDLDLLRGTLTVDEALKEISTSAKSMEGEKGLVFGPTKTQATRTIALPRFLCDLLAEHLARPCSGEVGPRALIFTTPTGRPMRHNLFYKRVFKPAVRAALPRELHGFRFHDLRHTCAALLIADGTHPLAIKTRLGHEDIRTTMNIYGHLFPSGEEALADALDAGYRSALRAETPALAALGTRR